MKTKNSARPATEADLDQVVQIEAEANRPPWSREAFAAEFLKRHGHFWVLTDDETDSLVYAYVVFAFPAEQAHIQTFAVAPSTRRLGHGKHLLRAVIAYVMRKKGESIILEVRESNRAAISLYQSLGFMIIHRMKNFYPDGEDAFALLYSTSQKKLSEADEPNPNRSTQNFN